MGDIGETVGEAVEKARESRLNTIVAACVALVATFMALCNTKDGNIVQAMAQAQAQAVDQWSYYQAKGVKQNLAESTMEQMQLQRDTTPNINPEARKQFDDKIADHASQVKKYDDEKKAIKKQAEDLEAQYNELNNHDDQFDMAEALLSVAIALFGVTALTQKRWLLGVAGVFAAVGVVMGVAGFARLGIHPDWLARFLS
jgi:DNA-directed RNA polymerase beta subunit